jgi:hypothetical protein
VTDETPARRAPAVAAVALVLALAGVAIALDIANARSGAPTGGLTPGWPSLLAGVPQAVLGILLVRTRPRHAVAWLLLASGLAWLVDAVSFPWLRYAVHVHPVLPGAGIAAWFVDRFGSLLLPLTAATVLFFPDGRLPRSRPWRWLAGTGLGRSC